MNKDYLLMERQKFISKLARILFYMYFTISIGFGLFVSILNLSFTISLKHDPDPNPGIGMYFEIIFPIIIAIVISAIVSGYQYIRYVKTFKLSLIPLTIWILSFVFLII
jgi:hypothetical protein